MPPKMRLIERPARYKFVWGGRGGGKSESIEKALLHIADTKKKRILCTREIQNSISESIFSSLVELINELEYKNFNVTKNTIRNEKTGSEIIFCGLYGQDRKQAIKSMANVDIAFVEEAQAVSDGSLKILAPTIRKEDSELWFAFNRLFPDDPIWKFKERIPTEKKIEININYNDNPYLPGVLLEEAERSKAEYEAGINDDYLHIWMGEPIGLSDRNILRLREIEEAMTREVSVEGQIEIGADIARHGKDRTVLVKRQGLKMISMECYNNTTVVETAGLIKAFINFEKSVPVKVDDTGVGGGVTDILLSEGYNVIPVNFGQVASEPDKYPNAISEMWFTLKKNIGEIQLLNNQDLKNEFVTREFGIDNKGRRCVESKEKYKKRYYKSPDMADAVLLAYYETNRVQIFVY